MTAGRPSSAYAKRRRPVFSRLGLLLLICLCVLFVSSYTSRLMRKADVEREIVEWEQNIVEAELQQQELQAELAYVNSPAYIEDVARNQLDMAREGDTVIIVVHSDPDVDGGQASADGAVDLAAGESTGLEEPTWTQWFELLAGEE